ncbi:MAG: amidase [Rhizobiales bacterium PAR1]|nr:MAG: amidase [Rhizobiales bacterium PAR1]
MTAFSARNIAQEVRAGTLDPQEVVEACLARIRERDADLGALTYVAEAEARATAGGIKARIGAGEALLLAGVPIIVKDNVWVEGMPITQGSRLFAGFQPPRDALAVARLKAAGAIIIGIGACPEFACKGFTNTAQRGITRHPTHPDRTPGGSSGGNVAGVVAGYAPISLGTDGGGSSRRPPAHVGLVGFKPTYGAIPHPYGFAEPFWNITCLAPIARDVADTALLFEVIAGPDGSDPDSRGIAPKVTISVPSLRMAVAPMLGLAAPVDTEVLEIFERALAKLSGVFSFTHAAPQWPADMTPQMLMAAQHAGLAAIHGATWRKTPELFDPDIAVQIERGFTLSGVEVASALETSQTIRRNVGAFFEEHDILVSLTTPCTAWKNDRTAPATIGGVPVEPRGHAVLTPMFNHAQTPAISIPCGKDSLGLPVGMQIIGPVGSDWKVLAVAEAFEALLS